ncbi:MAG: SecE/Sec61-gamma subunit of protein translocation complex [Thermoleophilia bacterium]|nr:SecE/Sec61-gamma subunit of protein translocation complex [Thermoleophilia bacterium]
MAKAANTGNRSPVPPPTGQRTTARKFIRESWGELKKVQWPTRQQVGTGTLVVGVVTAAIAAYISLIDQGAVRLVDQLNKLLN